MNIAPDVRYAKKMLISGPSRVTALTISSHISISRQELSHLLLIHRSCAFHSYLETVILSIIF